MTTAHHSADTGVRGRHAGRTRWAWLMVPTFAADFVITSFLGVWALDLLGLGEGDLFLFARNVAGWAVAIVFTAALAAPAVLGVVFAVQALRAGAKASAWAALAVNAVLVGFVAYMFFDQVRMTYWPGG